MLWQPFRFRLGQNGSLLLSRNDCKFPRDGHAPEPTIDSLTVFPRLEAPATYQTRALEKWQIDVPIVMDMDMCGGVGIDVDFDSNQ